MRRYFIAFTCMLLGLVVAYPKYLGDMNGDGTLTLADITKLVNIYCGVETNYDATLVDVNQDNNFDSKDITALVNMVLHKLAWVEVQETNESDTLYIYYNGTTATYEKPASWTDVTVNVVGANVEVTNVEVTNTNITDERVTVLSGTSTNGSFSYTGSYKTTVVLNGVTLTNENAAAININDGKRVNLELAEGTTNTLTDCADGAQKAALYCKGHLEISGSGSLNVTGLTKHAISAKEYIEVKSTTGNITVSGAVSDGIHCGNYFKMSGGSVKVSGVSGDAIQAEMQFDDTEDDGKIIIKDGVLDLAVTGTSTAALKCDSTLHIKGGDITITTTGNSDKALSSDENIEIDGGTLDITQSGSYTMEAALDENGDIYYDPSYVVGLKADSCIVINDGTLTITNTADGGRGMKADKDINIEGGTLTVYANGAGGVLDTSGASSGSTEPAASYKLYFSLPSTATSSNTGGFNPGGGTSTTTLAWSNINLYTSSGTQVATFSTQSSIAGSDGTTLNFYIHDFGAATSGSYYVTASYTATSSGGMGGPGGGTQTSSGTYTSSTFTLNLTGSNVFKSVTATKSSSGGWGGQSSSSYTFTLTDVTSNFANGSVATAEGDTYSAACVKADGNVNLNGGTLTLAHLGESSKGIKADNAVTLAGTAVSDAARGTYLVVGSDASYCTSVKCGSYQGTGGSFTLEATGAASRGISSDGTFNITGGTYDLALSGDGSLMPNDSSEGIGSVGFKSDGNMTLTGGDMTINNSAKGGKGIKVGNSSATGVNGATLTIGQSGASNDLLSLDVNTSGDCIATESSSGGWGGGPTDGGYVGSTKAIKVMGPITVNSGNIHLSTASDGAEGLESKYTITFNGGIFESDTYDDAINAAGCITFNDGYVWAHASGNDAIDSNSSSGTNGIVVNGGVIIGTSTTSPEEAFDCDDANFVLNGGIIIGVGGAQGGGGGSSTAGAPTSASQKYAMVTGVSLTQNTYISVKNSSSTVLCNYKQPNSFSSGSSMGGPSGGSSSGVNILVSHPNLGSSATITYNATSVSGTTSSVWNGAYTTGGTVSGGTSTSATVY